MKDFKTFALVFCTIVLVGICALFALGAAYETGRRASAPLVPQVPQTVAVVELPAEWTPTPLTEVGGPTLTVPTSTPAPTRTPAPTDTPEPTRAPSGPFVEWAGAGEAVSSNFRVTTCYKTVLVWAVTPPDDFVCIAVKLFRAGTDDYELMVNDCWDGGQTNSGTSATAVETGEYYLTVENTSGGWALSLICDD